MALKHVVTGDDLEMVKKWIAETIDPAVWTDLTRTETGGDYYLREDILAVIDSGRLLIESYQNGLIHGELDGQPFVYVNSLFGIVWADAVRVTL